ncbi:hypothetical protein CLIB1423_01S05820 [[Candida] railenensis]|uniref:Myb-like domain-containing protein n=1 Tax=[Candida] railenensis TaxID=45579 RepID=A0A9P0VVF9_9ASCO|nr:hypothetical protein CLIB1423_01S05820 [[Candida] railenensis]
MSVRPSFRGSPNYRRFYNNEVRNFLITGRGNGPGSSGGDYYGNFASSIISQNGDLSYIERKEKRKLRERDFNELEEVNENGAETIQKVKAKTNTIAEGTLWSAHEKEVFFSLLARYSIHQLDLIVDQLPSKTTIEVLNYYYLLKNELKALKSKFRGSPSHVHKCKVIMNHNQQPILHDYKIKKSYNSLCSMKHIPIAYEMSERFIDMEEIQAKLMIEKEMKLLNDFHKKFMVDMDEYDKEASTLMIRRKGRVRGKGSINNMTEQKQDSPALQYHKSGALRYSSQLSPLEYPIPDSETFTQDSSLIDIDNCHRISQRMYREYYGPKTTKYFIKVHYPPITLLDKLARLRTKEIILKLMSSKTIKEWVTGSSTAEREFTVADIHRVLGEPSKKIQFYVEPKVNLEDKNKMGKRKYKRGNSEDRNTTLTDESDPSSEHELLSDSSNVIRSDSDSEPPNIVIEDCEDENRPSDDFYSPTPPVGVPLHISQLPQNIRSLETQLETSINKLITERLHLKETVMLDKWDVQESKNYEHVLLTALTTYRETEADVDSSMNDIDSAFEMIEDEDFGDSESESEMEQGKTFDGEDAIVEMDDRMIADFTYLFPVY